MDGNASEGSSMASVAVDGKGLLLCQHVHRNVKGVTGQQEQEKVAK